MSPDRMLGTDDRGPHNLQELHRFALSLGLAPWDFKDDPGHPHYKFPKADRKYREALGRGVVLSVSHDEYMSLCIDFIPPPSYGNAKIVDLDTLTKEEIDRLT